MLKLIDIKKDYKVADSYVHALKGIDLEFRESEFVCILGQSGCGKTTLLNIIGGLDHYTTGDLVIGGKSTKDFKDRDWDVYRNHRIGFIFQSYNLIPHQTVLGNVEIALTIAGVSKEERRERAKRALERVGLGGELNKRPNQLSGGQMQRVAIARALVNNPEILLADEPTGALDSKTSVQIMELIKEIAGERLVIMVTHNPELAERYASRIVRLKDGLVEDDSNPYGGEDRAAAESPVSQTAAEEGAPETKKPKKARARMSWFTSLALSARNLLTKKGRTAATSIAGSIGIISVCLVLALSNGFNHYIKDTEEEMLSYYPVTVTESTFDMASVMTSFTKPSSMPDLSEIGDKVYVDSFLTGLANGMAVKNDISEGYLDYIGKMNKDWYSEVQYGYGAGLADNLFTTVDTAKENDENDLMTTNRSLSNLKAYYIDVLNRRASQYKELTGMADFFGNIVNKMPGTSDFEDENFAKYVLSQYDVVEGSFPKNENEVVLVVGAGNEVTDLTLAQLGFLDEQKFISLFKLGGEEATGEYMTIDFDDIVAKEFTLFYNDAVYEKNENYQKPTPLNSAMAYPFVYKGQRENITAADEEGMNLKVTGILRLKEGLSYGCLISGLNLTEAAVNTYIEHNMRSEIVKWTAEESSLGQEWGAAASPFSLAPAANLTASYYALVANISPDYANTPMKDLYITNDTEQVVRYLGGDDSVNSISFYATDFDSKDAMLNYLDEWNKMCEEGREYNGVVLTEGDKITYSDAVGVLMGMMQTMLNAITYVLVAFTAISLIVSSVMIGIITYVSVVERVKEIGVLRSLGARKQDIRNLFNAETFIIGLAAGVLGALVAYLISFMINAILKPLTGIAGLAALSPVAALVMIAISVALTLISGLIPASAAAKKDPVIALRTE